MRYHSVRGRRYPCVSYHLYKRAVTAGTMRIGHLKERSGIKWDAVNSGQLTINGLISALHFTQGESEFQINP